MKPTIELEMVFLAAKLSILWDALVILMVSPAFPFLGDTLVAPDHLKEYTNPASLPGCDVERAWL